MKKTFFLLFPLIFLMACGIYKTVTVDQLHLGMTRAKVEDIFGRPEKVLIVSMTEYGRQEILAYKIGNDIYSLEFMNDQLVRYEFLREDVVYVPPPPPPPQLLPVIIVHEDLQPIRPRPDERPPATKPSPPPAPSVNPCRTERETQRTERPNRRPGSERTNQEQINERNRPETSESSRTDRGRVDSGESNRNNRSSERSVQNRQTEDL